MTTRVGLEPLTSGSGVRGVNHQATAPSGFNCTNSVITQIIFLGITDVSVYGQIDKMTILSITIKRRPEIHAHPLLNDFKWY